MGTEHLLHARRKENKLEQHVEAGVEGSDGLTAGEAGELRLRGQRESVGHRPGWSWGQPVRMRNRGDMGREGAAEQSRWQEERVGLASQKGLIKHPMTERFLATGVEGTPRNPCKRH